LRDLFDGGTLETSGSVDEWRTLSGYGYQDSCKGRDSGCLWIAEGDVRCATEEYCRTLTDCNQPDMVSCHEGQCYTGTRDARCTEMPNTGEPGSPDLGDGGWCYDGRRDQHCDGVFDDEDVLPSPLPPPLLPAAAAAATARCTRQGINIQGQNGVDGQRDARIGIYFNTKHDCNAPRTGRVIGGTSLSAAFGDSHVESNLWVRIKVLAVLHPPPPPSYPPPASQRETQGISAHGDGISAHGDGVDSVTAIILGAVAGLIVVAIAAAFLLRFTIQQERMRRGVRLHNQENVVSPAVQLQPMSSIPTPPCLHSNELHSNASIPTPPIPTPP